MQPSFAITPNEETLNQEQRDLRFHPSTVTEPKVLTLEQVEAFNTEGYLKGIRIFSDGEMGEHRRYFDQLLARVIAAGGDSYSISTAHMKYGPVYDILTNPRIVAVVADILGDNVVGWGSHYFCKMPHDGKQVAWHQDASYWPLTPAKTVTVWLAIDDADRDNACMRFLPRTHTLGHLTYKMTEDQDANVLNQEIENIQQYGEPVDDELKAGEMSIHADLLLHGSEGNTSDRRRCGLTLRYCAADVRAYAGWEAKGVMVRGIDPTGRWGNPPRPESS